MTYTTEPRNQGGVYILRDGERIGYAETEGAADEFIASHSGVRFVCRARRGEHGLVLDYHPTTHGAVVYRPFIGDDGQVGFQVISSDGRVEFIYLNPSDDTDGGQPSVSLCQGPSGDPAQDGSHHSYNVLEADSSA